MICTKQFSRYLISEQASLLKDGSAVLVVWKQLEGVLDLGLLFTDVALDVYVHLSGQCPQAFEQRLGTGGGKPRGNDGINEGVLPMEGGIQSRLHKN
jgi:hypothetical protein